MICWWIWPSFSSQNLLVVDIRPTASHSMCSCEQSFTTEVAAAAQLSFFLSRCGICQSLSSSKLYCLLKLCDLRMRWGTFYCCSMKINAENGSQVYHYYSKLIIIIYCQIIYYIISYNILLYYFILFYFILYYFI